LDNNFGDHAFPVICYIVTPLMVRFLFKLCGVIVLTVISNKLWSLRSPYLNLYGCYLWILLKDKMYCNSPCIGDELKEIHLMVMFIARRNLF